MTVLMAFTSHKQKMNFIGSDDKELYSGHRHEKVGLFLNRFLIGCIGNNTLINAVEIVSSLGEVTTLLRDFSYYKSPASVQEFCEKICLVLPNIAAILEKNMIDSVGNGIRTQEQYLHLIRQHSSLVVIDTINYQLSEVKFNLIFPAKSSYSFKIIDLPAERLFRFGIDEPLDLGLIHRDAYTHPFHWCSNELENARRLLDEHNHKDFLGELGCCYVIRPNKIIKKSAYASLEEVVQRWYPQKT